jgi:hypothetical protein
MAHDHRMNPVGSNHRPTPRLAQLVAKATTPPSTPEEAQQGLDKYRGYRDAHNDPAYEEQIDEDQEFLNSTFKERHL